MHSFSAKSIFVMAPIILGAVFFVFTGLQLKRNVSSVDENILTTPDLLPLSSESPTVFTIGTDSACDDSEDWLFESGEISARVDMIGFEGDSCVFELSFARGGEYEIVRCSIERNHGHNTFSFAGDHFEIDDIDHHCEQLEVGPIGL